MKKCAMRFLTAAAACSLLVCSLCIGGTSVSAESSTLTLNAADKTLLESSYQSLCDRLTERGYAQTSLTGAYNGMFVRDASIQAMAHLSRGDDESARSLLEYMIRYHEEMDLDHTVRIIAPLTDDAYNNSNGSVTPELKNDGKNGYFADGTPVALFQTKAPNNACAFKITPSDSSIENIRLYMNGAASTTVYIVDDYKADLSAARGEVTGGSSTVSGAGWYTFTFPKAVSVTPNQTYYVVVQSASNASGGVIFGGAGGTGESYNYDKNALGGWSTKTNGVWFGLNIPKPQPDAVPAGEAVVTFGKDASVGQVLPAKVSGNDVMTAVRVVLGKKSGAAGDVTATLYKGTDEKGQKIDTVKVSADTLTADGKWVTFSFSLPAGGTKAGDSYYLSLSASSAAADSIVWYGKKDQSTCVTTRTENGETKTVNGDGFYDCRKSTIKAVDSMIQVDAHYMLLHSWYLYMDRAKDCPEKTAFFNETWETVKKFANYFVKDNASQYIHSTYSLVINPNFEHTIHMMKTMDLMTNVFTSQALHELSGIAEKQNENALATEWKGIADKIADGVNKYLVVKRDKFDGEAVYADRLDMDDPACPAVPLFTFVCYAPMAAEWYAMDDTVMANTYKWYSKLGSLTFGGVSVPDIYYPYDDFACKHQSHNGSTATHNRGNHVVGRQIGYELLYASSLKNVTRLNELLKFLRENSDKVYPEVWRSNGTKSDVGNQEQVSWIVYGIMTALDRLKEEEPTPTTTTTTGSKATGTGSATTTTRSGESTTTTGTASTTTGGADESSEPIPNTGVGMFSLWLGLAGAALAAAAGTLVLTMKKRRA